MIICLAQDNDRAAQPGDPRLTDVIGIFPTASPSYASSAPSSPSSTTEWAEGRRYLGVNVLSRSSATAADTAPEVDPKQRHPGAQRLTRTKDHASATPRQRT